MIKIEIKTEIETNCLRCCLWAVFLLLHFPPQNKLSGLHSSLFTPLLQSTLAERKLYGGLW